MVVSKDNKRRRKETETPPPPPPLTAPTVTPTSQSTAAVESSPEMPKRTKVQAQRKFAQGQSAPTSSSSAAYSAALSAVTTGVAPSTSAESREPPIEILPNRRPKTQDFLTFLCFRGTSTLPPHLDYLNQGNSKETETTTTTKKTNNNNNKTLNKQNNKKGKRGRPKNTTKSEGAAKKVAKLKNDTVETSGTVTTAAATTTTNASAMANNKAAATVHIESNNLIANEAKPVAIIPGAVRKRAEVVPEGNRRGRRSGGAAAISETNSKCNSNSHSSPEAKRRSNRASAKEGRPMIEAGSDEEDEYFPMNDEATKDAKTDIRHDHQEKTVLRQTKELHMERKSETPSKESETGKSTVGKRGRPPANATTKKIEEATNSPQLNDGDKTKLLPAKRMRQRESPIFIPSPESSGRMTRQRAFFEPVKVLPQPENIEDTSNTKAKDLESVVKSEKQSKSEEINAKLENVNSTKKNQQTSKETKANASIYAKDAKTRMENVNGDKSKTNLNVFDFSSDDEQPLAKSIKLKKGKASPKKATNAPGTAIVRGRKSAAKKFSQVETDSVAKETETVEEIKTPLTTAPEKNDVEEDLAIKTEPTTPPETEKNTKAKPKRGRVAKKKVSDSHAENETESTPTAAKKVATNASTANARQSRGKSKVVGGKVNEVKDFKNRSPSQPASPVRSQRPSRKTKEAAAIYMGIIGHKLQLADDDDDDLSLSSFPDIPNVREMEKMENEIKKHAAQAQPATMTSTTASQLLTPKAAATSSTATKPVTSHSTTNSRKSTPSRSAVAQSPQNSVANASATTTTTTKIIATKCVTSGAEPKSVDKPTPRRGRPPKQPKAMPLPPKREIEGMLVKKGALTKIANATANAQDTETPKVKSEQSKIVDTQSSGHNADEDDDEDFLINEELNETKRKLEKSFSDSDDEPLAIKANVKGGSEKEDFAAALTEAEVSPVVVKPERTTPKKPILAAAVTTPPTTMSTPTQLQMLPITTKHTPPLLQPLTPTPSQTTAHHLGLATPTHSSTSPLNAQHQPTSTYTQLAATTTTPPALQASVGLKSMEKKSPIPQSKILNVPATFALAGTIGLGTGNVTPFNKTSPYLPQASPHYHNTSPYIRPAPPPTPTHQFSPTPSMAKSPTTTPTVTPSPLKYQTPPTTYPPPIEAYQCPKINPNFLTPKFDRTTLPRSNNFPTPLPSPIKFSTSGLSSLSGSPAVVSISASSTAFSKSIMPSTTANFATQITTTMTSANATPSTSAAAAVGSNGASIVATAGASLTAQLGAAASTMANDTNAINNTSFADPLKDEIGSILKATASKEESKKIFGIASVTLAQSSGPDNTKCTLGKCGSVHKPVLGPVVPTEGYFGDQLTSKERRKAKVNMTHEQIQKWLIECSSNPDEIQDDLDDDFDDSLRPNQSTTPPPASNARDDKESTSFSSSSKNTRAELGKSESAWSAKGPSLKATPVVASASRKQQQQHQIDLDDQQAHGKRGIDELGDYDKAVNLTQKSMNFNDVSTTSPSTAIKEQVTDKKATDKKAKDVKLHGMDNSNPSGSSGSKKQVKSTIAGQSDKATAASASAGISGADQLPNSNNSPTKANRNKKNAVTPNTSTSTALPASQRNANNNNNNSTTTPKRTPVYNQKCPVTAPSTPRQAHETTTTKTATTTTSQKRMHAPQDSVYAFDKDETVLPKAAANAPPTTAAAGGKSSNRRQARSDERTAETKATVRNQSPVSVPNALSERSPTKKRAAAAAAATAVSLTLSPTDNCKLVRVSLDGGQAGKTSKSTRSTAAAAKKLEPEPPPAKVAKTVEKPTPVTTAAGNDADSDADGATFYIPLQGAGVGGANNGGIQGVAVKLGREGPDGPNQKVVMQATLVTKAQMGNNPKTDALNTNDLVKTLLNAANAADVASNGGSGGNAGKKPTGTPVGASTSAAAAAATAVTGTNSASNSLKSVPRHKSVTVEQQQLQQPQSATNATANSGLVRVNSCSSLFSGSAKSRCAGPANTNTTSATSIAKKFKDDTPIKMANNTAFPRHDDPTQMVEAPIFRPTEKEFADPIEFIERITPIAARFGICKIVPPTTFKPECRISDEMRFTAYNQYVHKMLQRWGPSAKELSAIKKYLATQSIMMNHPPWIGGMEVDLPRLYHTVQELGGLKEVIEKKKWARVAEEMCIPKLAQDRVTKLDDIYCKYLLPYDTLSPAERQKLFDEVEADWAKREARARRNADRFVNTESVSNEEDDASTDEDDESEEEIDGVSMECIVKGRSMPLSQFYRIARNTMALWFKQTEPTVNEVEAEFWRHVAVRDSHVCVHSGSIDSSGWGYGFPSPGPKSKGSNYARHPWNLKVLTNNAGSVLRSLGPVMGVTVPTLHVGMLFSACCWYRDPHGLSWIEYLHTGASKLWYGIPDDQSANFRAALTSLIPTHCQNKTIWLPCDTVMVPPHMLTDRGVSLCRIEQKPGEYIVVFPRAYTSSLATGYVVSESVYFATMSWLDLAKDDFRDIHESCEPAMFSLEQLLFALGYDQRVNSDVLQQMLPMLNDVCEKETAAREQLKAAGVTSTEKVQTEKGSNKAKKQQPSHKSIESECEMCRANLYISMVRTDDDNVYCLQHALKNLNNGNIQAKQCKLIYAFNVDDIQQLIRTLKDKIQQKRNTAIVGKKK